MADGEKSDFLQAITAAVEAKFAERSAALDEKEKRLKATFGSDRFMSRPVRVDVGSRTFYTDAQILSGSSLAVTGGTENFFTKTLAQHWREGATGKPSTAAKEADPLVLRYPRDGDSFAYVLQYLTYNGKLLNPPRSRGMLRLVQADADFFVLPELGAQCARLLAGLGDADSDEEDTGGGGGGAAGAAAAAAAAGKRKLPKAIKLTQGTLPSSGSTWQWGKVSFVHDSYFRYDTSSHRVTVLKAGYYRVTSRTLVQSSNQYYASLRVNGAQVAQVFQNCGSDVNQTSSFHELLELKPNDYIDICQTFSSSPTNGDPYNMLAVELVA